MGYCCLFQQSELSEVEGVIKEKTTALTVIKTELREIKTKVGKIEEKLENFSKATEQLESRLDPIQVISYISTCNNY